MEGGSLGLEGIRLGLEGSRLVLESVRMGGEGGRLSVERLHFANGCRTWGACRDGAEGG